MKKDRRIKQRISDMCTRSNSTSAPGKTQTGQSWTTRLGTCGINSNQLYASALSSGWAIVTTSPNMKNGVLTAKLTIASEAEGGIIFRYANNDNFLALSLSASADHVTSYVFKFLSGDFSAVTDEKYSGPAGDNVYNVEIHLNNTNYKIYVNGSKFFDFTEATNATNTLIGFLFLSTSIRGDNFNFYYPKAHNITPIIDLLNNAYLSNWVVESPGNAWNMGFSADIKDEGTHSLRIELRRDDLDVITGDNRCELSGYNFPEGQLEEHIYAISTYLPGSSDGTDEWLINPFVWEDEIIFQWHNRPDTGLGEDWTMPPLAVHVDSVDGIYLSLCSDANTVTTDAGLTAAGYPHNYNLITDLSSVKGKWVRWTFHVKWGWLAEHNPLIEVWKQVIGADAEPVKISTITEPNMTNDLVGVDFNFGIYKPQWGWEDYGDSGQTKRIVYYDNVSIK